MPFTLPGIMLNSLADTGEMKEVKAVFQHPKEKKPTEIKAGKEIRTIAQAE